MQLQHPIVFHELQILKDKVAQFEAKELEAKNEVELDPKVLFETKHDYLIITAWSDEANNELIVNQKK